MNGKGDRNRTSDWDSYRDNYDEIEWGSDMGKPVLCYVSGCWAYFTTQPLEEQWGDDWNDAPYEHNAEPPIKPCWHNKPEHVQRRGHICQCDACKSSWNEDGTPKWEIVRIAFDGPFDQPCDNHVNSPYSVEQINKKHVPWLTSAGPVIFAGTTLSEFVMAVKEAGGYVWITDESNAKEGGTPVQWEQLDEC